MRSVQVFPERSWSAADLRSDDEADVHSRLEAAFAELGLQPEENGFPVESLGDLLSSRSFGLRLHPIAVSHYIAKLAVDADEHQRVTVKRLISLMTHIQSLFGDSFSMTADNPQGAGPGDTGDDGEFAPVSVGHPRASRNRRGRTLQRSQTCAVS